MDCDLCNAAINVIGAVRIGQTTAVIGRRGMSQQIVSESVSE